jgi:hypothetical protein
MVKLRNKKALPGKVAATSAEIRNWHLHKWLALLLYYPFGTCVTKKVVFITIPWTGMSEVRAGTDVFLTIRSNRQIFCNTHKFLSYF